MQGLINYFQDPDYLTIANGVFSDKAFALINDYVDKARIYMNAEVKSLNFAGDSATGASEINKWVKYKTDGKISEIFEPGNFK